MMNITKKEVDEYLDAVSKEIFRKPLNQLNIENIQTLKLSLIFRKRNEELDEETYNIILDTLIKKLRR